MSSTDAPITALVSWAHRNVGWTNQQAEDWTATVVTFATLLRRHGIDADLDLWHESDSSIDWTRWGQQRVAECDYVIIAISTAWKQRWEGSNSPTVGAGAVAEANTLKGRFNTDQGEFQRRTIVVVLPGVADAELPFDLHHLLRMNVDRLDASGIESVLRALTAQPLHTMPELGTTPVLPPVNLTVPASPTPVDLETVRSDYDANRAALDAGSASSSDDSRETSHEKQQYRSELRQRLSRSRGLLRGLSVDETPPREAISATPATSLDLGREHSSEQLDLLAHPISAHGVVLAGPGTGKSTTVLELAARIHESSPETTLKIISFTRAATRELVGKIHSGGHDVDEPMTVHAFALSVLMRNPEQSPLPQPLRIPDDWETKELLQQDLSRRLKAKGHQASTPTMIGKLINEMSAGWESMDENRILLVDIDPSLRSAFRSVWNAQRGVFGYSLFAEMTYSAAVLLEDLPSPNLGGLDLLVVDEYQDLNRADIAMIQAVAERGVAILAVGDDDQSIYGFRHAAPQGIQTFAHNSAFPGARTYTLSTSYRCGSSILAAAGELIESSATRLPKPPLKATQDNPAGEIAYLRFPSERAEIDGVCQLLDHLIRREGIPADQAIVLVRSDHRKVWSGPLHTKLESLGLPVVDIEQFREPLQTKEARRLIAMARLMNNDDDLAWWTLLKLTRGVGDGFVAAVADEAVTHQKRFHARLLVLREEPLLSLTGTSPNAVRIALQTVDRVLELRGLAQNIAPPEPDENRTWADWLFDFAEFAGLAIDERLRALLESAGVRTSSDDDLDHFLGSLDHTAQELALEEPAIAIMSMSRSKGLTRTAVFVMGVEEGIVPPARDDTDYEEERRLLYVAMTRARTHLYCTWAAQRTGPTARTGGGTPGTGRARSRYFRDSALKPENGPAYVQSRISSTTPKTNPPTCT